MNLFGFFEAKESHFKLEGFTVRSGVVALFLGMLCASRPESNWRTCRLALVFRLNGSKAYVNPWPLGSLGG